ncbi:MAG: prepilin-type N-terminal cleavage/methylation domain-containing protein [Thermaceae bacterium]|nr:prepilin-type N-terminal cleavage/methylation domain-containing protein [Thermaceae bacterium]
MQKSGFTLIELLISLSLLLVVLAVASDLIVSNQRVANTTVLRNQIAEDARLSILRMTEIVSQSAYIYPAGQTITLSGFSVNTSSGLVVLVPWESPYCNDNNLAGNAAYKTYYCGFIYRVEPRAPYAAKLGNVSNTTGQVLVEYRYRWVSWPTNTTPITNWTALSAPSVGVVADSVDTANTDLVGNLQLAARSSPVDTGLKNDTSVTTSSANALIWAVQPQVGLALTYGQTSLSINRSEVMYARAIPRVADPGTGF